MLGWLFTEFFHKISRHRFIKLPMFKPGEQVWTTIGYDRVLVRIYKYVLCFDKMGKNEVVLYTVVDSSGHKWDKFESELWRDPQYC